jgi:hypothetical protein
VTSAIDADGCLYAGEKDILIAPTAQYLSVHQASHRRNPLCGRRSCWATGGRFIAALSVDKENGWELHKSRH